MEMVVESRDALVDELEARLEFEEDCFDDFKEKLEEKVTELKTLEEEKNRRTMKRAVLKNDDITPVLTGRTMQPSYSNRIYRNRKKAIEMAKRLTEGWITHGRSVLLDKIQIEIPQVLTGAAIKEQLIQKLLNDFERGRQ